MPVMGDHKKHIFPLWVSSKQTANVETQHFCSNLLVPLSFSLSPFTYPDNLKASLRSSLALFYAILSVSRVVAFAEEVGSRCAE